MNEAQKTINEIGLTENTTPYHYFSTNEICNDEVITLIQNECCSYNGDEIELFVFTDNSCINRQGDEYFVNDNVEMLDYDYLKAVGFE